MTGFFYPVVLPKIPKCTNISCNILLSNYDLVSPKRPQHFNKLLRYCTEHLYILQLVLQIGPLSLEHVSLVQGIL